jgi:polyferredoxin
MAFIALEAVAGVTCPLTIWEDALRGAPEAPQSRGFVSRWVAAVLFWDWPAWVFAAIYAAWTALIVATWFFVPPRSGVR